MNATEEYLFVYGTLMQTSENSIHLMLKKHGSFAGEGRYRGKLFMVGGYPGAVPSTDPADLVTGELYALENTTALFVELDAYEGVDDEEPDRSLYRRVKKEIAFSESGKTIYSWIYLYNGPIQGLTRIRSGNYLEYLHYN